jgi:CRP-like cAMP-binding protein
VSDGLEEFGAGAALIRQGEMGDHAYILESGSVKIASDQDGFEQVLAIASAGEVVGEMALFDDAPRSASVVALEPVRARKMTREGLAELMRSDPAASVPFLNAILERLRTSNTMLAAATRTQALVRMFRVKLKLPATGGPTSVEVEVDTLTGAAKVLRQEPPGSGAVSASADLPAMRR